MFHPYSLHISRYLSFYLFSIHKKGTKQTKITKSKSDDASSSVVCRREAGARLRLLGELQPHLQLQHWALNDIQLALASTSWQELQPSFIVSSNQSFKEDVTPRRRDRSMYTIRLKHGLKKIRR